MTPEDQIIDAVIGIPSEDWELIDGLTKTYLARKNDKVIYFDFNQDNVPCITIDGVEFFNKGKIYLLSKKLNEYTETKKKLDMEKTVSEIFNALCPEEN